MLSNLFGYMFGVVMFVFYLTKYLLNDILEGYQSRCTAKFIDHDGHVDAARLEIVKQVIDLTCLGNEKRRTYKRLPTETVALFKIRKQILNVKDSFFSLLYLGLLLP